MKIIVSRNSKPFARHIMKHKPTRSNLEKIEIGTYTESKEGTETPSGKFIKNATVGEYLDRLYPWFNEYFVINS